MEELDGMRRIRSRQSMAVTWRSRNLSAAIFSR
jgi:hypothetical protein